MLIGRICVQVACLSTRTRLSSIANLSESGLIEFENGRFETFISDFVRCTKVRYLLGLVTSFEVVHE